MCDSVVDASMFDDVAHVNWADTIEELAAQICMDPEVLVETVERYNGFVDAGEDADFGKNMPGTTRLENPPFFALTLRPRPFVSYGGVRTDVDSHVLTADGTPIPGLYASGIVCGCYPEQEGLAYNGGLNQALNYGFQAGYKAAQEA